MYTEKDLFSNNDEQNRGNFDTDVGILELFGKETLENLQSIISKVTGLGFVTADFRGEPLTCMTGFTPFWTVLPESVEIMENCAISLTHLVLSVLLSPVDTASIFVLVDRWKSLFQSSFMESLGGFLCD